MTHEHDSAVHRWLSTLGPGARLTDQFRMLASNASVLVPFPASGRTLERWQILSDVASHDLSLIKLFEGHTDALAILNELHHVPPVESRRTWAVWASESPGGRVTCSAPTDGVVRLHGSKQWCSGAQCVTDALVTAWFGDGQGPFLVQVALQQPEISVSAASWQAVGMANSGSMDVKFDGAIGELVGGEGDYIARPGFMQGGAGIAACWFGGAVALASTLHRAVGGAPDLGKIPFRSAALGKVDTALGQTAALLRETAAFIDRSPHADASIPALRVRQSADACARIVLDEVGRALGATPFCRDRKFARMAADLVVFTRQSLAERDFQGLGERLATLEVPSWRLTG